jgi:biotin transport system substrate-specific component
MPHYRASTGDGSAAAIAAARDAARWAGVGARAGAIAFAALATAVAAQVSVHVPGTPVPFTLQPITVLVAGAVLGARLGAASQLLYLVLGVTGAAMFAWSPLLAPGLGRLLGPTGGFLLAFPLAAYAAGTLADRGWTRTWSGAVLTMTAGLAVLYAGGGAQLAALTGSSSLVALWPFVLADVVKVAAAAAVLPRLSWAAGRRG